MMNMRGTGKMKFLLQIQGWDNKNIFRYAGEGQEGDMQFVKGN
jgi:hypothetical protein